MTNLAAGTMMLALMFIVGVGCQGGDSEPDTSVASDTGAGDTGDTGAGDTGVSVDTGAGDSAIEDGGSVDSTDQPVLFFSDLDSGPATGNGDTSGGRTANEHGAMVTIWGRNFGSVQGTSRVYIGGVESPYVYFWGNATSPANLYESHQMQKISFQVHRDADDSGISVVTSKGTSNLLPFTVRTGNIYFVDDDGDAGGGSGTYSDPWTSPASYVSQLASGEDGATCYFRAGTYANTEYGATTRNRALFYLNSRHSGSAGMPNAFVGYPGELASFEATDGTSKSDANYFWGIFRDYESRFWDTGSNLNNNVLHYLTISNLRFVVNTAVTTVRNHWRFVGNHCESDPDGTVYNSGTGLVMYGYKIEETADAFLQEAVIYGNIMTGDTSRNKLNHGFYLGTGDSPDIGWNHIYGHDIESGPYFSINSEDAIQRGDGRLINARIHDNLIDTTGFPSRILSVHQLPQGSTVYIYNNVFVGPVSPSSPVVNIRSGGIHMYNNTFYNDISAGFTSPMIRISPFIDNGTPYYSDVIDFRNNVFWAFGATRTNETYIQIEDYPDHPTPIMDHNVWMGIPGGAFLGQAVRGANSLVDVDPEFVDADGGDFHLRPSSPARDIGTDEVAPIVTDDIDGHPRPQRTGYSVGAYEM